MAARWLDRLLIVLFLFTSFMSLVYAPLFVFGCGWDGLTLGPDGPCGATAIGRAWLGYVQVEPIYRDAPVWLRLVNELDMFFFSWFYVLSVIVFLGKRQDRAWYRGLATFMAGMMSYAIGFYLIWELRTYRDTGAQIVPVVIFNGMWLVIFGLLMLRVHVLRPRAG
ncbi:hypothetical protein [Solimonas soli]|uniref:hypothetical protein n=1 Tax=Solimonas soli TaxID=413479 RepID=UPI0004875B85|nr:hypothetical protein [Solimonas soli]